MKAAPFVQVRELDVVRNQIKAVITRITLKIFFFIETSK